ncbi:MAG: thioredoxin domain-containing protein [Candidatus Methanoperedens sp.]|nr:thioredoxin domain-containing protein [Candidatus Methanoperedens sp.]
MAKKKHIPPPKKSNPALVYAGLAALVIAALVIFFTSGTPPEKTGKLPTAGEYLKLSQQSNYEPGIVKIMVFMKFDCPHCYELDKNMPQLLQKYGDKVKVTYVPIVWPKQSTKSIEAYIIAERMGKGKEMRVALFRAKFEKGMDIMESTLALEDVAASIGLEADFNAQLEGGDGKKAAQANLALMNKYGVQGTPTVVINGNLDVNPAIANLDTVIGSLLS